VSSSHSTIIFILFEDDDSREREEKRSTHTAHTAARDIRGIRPSQDRYTTGFSTPPHNVSQPIVLHTHSHHSLLFSSIINSLSGLFHFLYNCLSFKVMLMEFWKPGAEKPNGTEKETDEVEKINTTRHNETMSSSGDPSKKASLSSTVMAMKFMKRKSDADAEAHEQAEKRRKLLDSQWTSEGTQVTSSNNGLVCTRDDSDLFSALPGRRSFGGFNRPVEKYYEQIMDEKRFEKAAEKVNRNSVSDEEMLARYENLIGLPRGPSQGQRQQQPRPNRNHEGKTMKR
jgi:hypothetical protein